MNPQCLIVQAPGGSGKIQTLDFKKMSRVFDHCAAETQPIRWTRFSQGALTEVQLTSLY